MKVREKTALDALLQREIGRKRGDSGAERVNNRHVALDPQSDEQIDVSRGRVLSELLDPQAVGAERAAKIQKIKELVQSGKYFQERPISAIAQALAEGINEEIDIQRIFARDGSDDDE